MSRTCPCRVVIAFIAQQWQCFVAKISTAHRPTEAEIAEAHIGRPVELSEQEQKQAQEQHTNNVIAEYFSERKQEIKDEVRMFMLFNFNISHLDDKIEGDAYDFIVDKIWELTVGRVV